MNSILKTKATIDVLLRMHEWRQKHNGQNYGLGYDPYKPQETFHYAESYAHWGIGYARLSKLTGDSFFLEEAENCANWLATHCSPDYILPSWGLPWIWDKWKTPVNLSFLITTVFVGELFLLLAKMTQKANYLDYAKQIATGIIEDNDGMEEPEGLRLFYANFSPLRFPVVNPTAKACGFFADLYSQSKEEIYKDLCDRTASWIFSQQNQNGSWFYSNQGNTIDCIHTGFTLEGLGIARNIFEYKNWDPNFERGFQYYWQSFFYGNGRATELVNEKLRKTHWFPYNDPRSFLLTLMIGKTNETRLWGYASALRAFIMGSQINEKWIVPAKIIFSYMQKNLRNSDGSFAYLKKDRRAFIRHQAHVFSAMALAGLKFQDTTKSIDYD